MTQIEPQDRTSRIAAVRLSPTDYEKLLQVSDSLGVSRSDVLRILLREYSKVELLFYKK